MRFDRTMKLLMILPTVVLVGVMSVARTALATQETATWLGGTGNWSDPTKWSGGVVPNNGSPIGTTYSVVIDGMSGTDSIVTLDISVAIDKLTVDAGDQLGIFSGRSLTVVDSGAGTGKISNAGTIALNSTGSSTDIRISGATVTLGGGGSLTMSNNPNNRIFGLSTGNEELVNVNNTISGAGQIGLNLLAFTNQGVVVADQSAGLVIDPSTAGVVNSGTLRASGGGTLFLSGAPVDNTGGLIRVDSSSGGSTVNVSASTITAGTVDLVGAGAGNLNLNSGTITGGILANNATGVIRAKSGASTLGGAVTNPAGGQVIVDNGTTLVLESSGTYANTGQISLNSTGSSTDLRISGSTVTLGGGGTLTMSNNPNNRIFGVSTGTEKLVNADNIISGAGQIGVNLMAFTNQGTVRSDQSGGLLIDPNQRQNFVNMGTVEEAAASTLSVASGDNLTQKAGTTRVDGTLSGSGLLKIVHGALMGRGVLDIKVSNGGAVSPGASPGALHLSNKYTQTAGGTLQIELNGPTPSSGYDRLIVKGGVSLAGTLSLSLGFTPTVGETFSIIANGGADGVVGTFDGLPEGGTITLGTTQLHITYVGGTGNDVVLVVDSVARARGPVQGVRS